MKIVTNDGSVFHSENWSYGLVDALERKARERHGGVDYMMLVSMTEEEYSAIPVTMQSAELFSLEAE